MKDEASSEEPFPMLLWRLLMHMLVPLIVLCVGRLQYVLWLQLEFSLDFPQRGWICHFVVEEDWRCLSTTQYGLEVRTVSENAARTVVLHYVGSKVGGISVKWIIGGIWIADDVTRWRRYGVVYVGIVLVLYGCALLEDLRRKDEEKFHRWSPE